jgi:predicted MFS family arabinose efflux permease
LVLASCAGTGLAHLATTTMPFQIGALVDAGRSPRQAGLFGLCQIGALAGGMMLSSLHLGRVSTAILAVCGALLATAANFGLYFAQYLPLQLLFGALAGLGFGLVFAATIAGAAGSEEADRLYGIANSGALLLILLVLIVVPAIAGRLGPRSIFMSIAGIALASSATLSGLKSGGSRAAKPPTLPWRAAGTPALLLSWAALSIGTGALYSFSERIGRQIHLRPEVIGAVLSAGLVIGLLGTALAAYTAGRMSRPRALVVGMVGTGVSCLLVGYAAGLGSFAAGELLYMLSYMFLYCYLLGTAAKLDPTGRIGALGAGLERLSYSCGVWMGGVLAQYYGYSSTGAVGFAGCMLALVLGFPSLFRALERPISVRP